MLLVVVLVLVLMLVLMLVVLVPSLAAGQGMNARILCHGEPFSAVCALGHAEGAIRERLCGCPSKPPCMGGKGGALCQAAKHGFTHLCVHCQGGWGEAPCAVGAGEAGGVAAVGGASPRTPRTRLFPQGRARLPPQPLLLGGLHCRGAGGGRLLSVVLLVHVPKAHATPPCPPPPTNALHSSSSLRKLQLLGKGARRGPPLALRGRKGSQLGCSSSSSNSSSSSSSSSTGGGALAACRREGVGVAKGGIHAVGPCARRRVGHARLKNPITVLILPVILGLLAVLMVLVLQVLQGTRHLLLLLPLLLHLAVIHLHHALQAPMANEGGGGG